MLRIKHLTVVLSIFAGLLLGNTAMALRVIPLEIANKGDAKRLVIYVGINGGQPFPYLFDTGSAGFNASYFNGNYTGPGENPFDWKFSSYYEGFEPKDSYAGTFYTDGVGDLIKPCYVEQIEIYNPYDLSTPAVILKANEVNPDSEGFIVNQLWQILEPVQNNETPDWTDRGKYQFVFKKDFRQNLKQGLAPFTDGLYGTFGAGMFTGYNTSNPDTTVDFINSSVLGQATTSGYAVVANANATAAYVILDINEPVFLDQFDTVLEWVMNGNTPYAFPNSQANSGIEYGVGEFTIMLSQDNNDPVSWSVPVSIDTGTPEYTLHYSGNATGQQNLENNYIAADTTETIKAGVEATVHGTTANAASYRYTVTYNTAFFTTDHTTVSTGESGDSTLGVGFFLNNAITYNLASRRTRYTPDNIGLPPSINPSAGVLPKALRNSIPFGNKHFLSPWLGMLVKFESDAFLYTLNMGWVWPDPAGTEAGTWLWSNNLNSWLWGSMATGHFLYMDSLSKWIYAVSSPGGGSFYLADGTQDWVYVSD